MFLLSKEASGQGKMKGGMGRSLSFILIGRVTLCPRLPGTVSVYAGCPGLIINSSLIHF